MRAKWSMLFGPEGSIILWPKGSILFGQRGQICLAFPVQEQADETPQVVRRISGKQRRASLEEYKETFLTVLSIEDRKPVFLSRSTRDALDRIVRMFGERRMSVSGLVENIARQHLDIYGEDIEAWRKL